MSTTSVVRAIATWTCTLVGLAIGSWGDAHDGGDLWRRKSWKSGDIWRRKLWRNPALIGGEYICIILFTKIKPVVIAKDLSVLVVFIAAAGAVVALIRHGLANVFCATPIVFWGYLFSTNNIC